MRSAGHASLHVIADSPPVTIGASGELSYQSDERGNRIPDFSACGYRSSREAIPLPPVRAIVQPAAGDDGARIQAAIDHVAQLPTQEDGFRGVVLLYPGTFQVADAIRLHTDGIVLRGCGGDNQGTSIVGTGTSRQPLIYVEPARLPRYELSSPMPVADAYVPVGATQLKVSDTESFSVGDRVRITRPSTEDWIETLGMRVRGVGWRAGRCDIQWERTIVAVKGRQLTVDAPITTALDRQFGGGTISRIAAVGRLTNIGIEDLNLVSQYDSQNPRDEDHRWFGVVTNHLENGWIRRVRHRHFAGGAILLREDTHRVTVEDCLMLDPISELGGYRRNSFFTQGQQTLFLRCYAESGLHDFSVGHCAAGPNAFVHCSAEQALGGSGPLESWASGVLYDNVHIDGGELTFSNRWTQPPGTGWSAANCVSWQCRAAVIRAFRPPLANNWVIGYWAEPLGDAAFHQQSSFVRPISLFQAQLANRLDNLAAERVGPFLLDPQPATNPTLQQAAEFVAQSNGTTTVLRDLIERQIAAIGTQRRETKSETEVPDELLKQQTSKEAADKPAQLIEIINGWITRDGKLLTGGHINPTWWRGTVRPLDAPSFGPSITRFAPGRYGTGLTDRLETVVEGMLRRNQVVYDHHYGLWYDRRRDDHLMNRRSTGAVAPPFYEQPFARSGQGEAWDRLSRYDLTKFNPWYWDRLALFASLADQNGLVLFHQHYFQHNILEAGAHWADSPWRPANNINAPPFPEPPPYASDKRIFLAHRFYDIADGQMHDLHSSYLVQCLGNFASNHNVIHSISAEYSGPLHFTQFWIDTIRTWSEETQNDPLIALATTKDVQDAILADQARADTVDIIDIRYWCYDKQGQLYAPAGGVNLAPRQHQRQLRPDSGSFESVALAIREMRQLYPDKPVTYYADMYCRSPRDGWAVLMGGGSLPEIPPLPEALARAIPHMAPTDATKDRLQLTDETGHWLVYLLQSPEELELNLPTGRTYQLTWLDPATGRSQKTEPIPGGPTQVTVASRLLWIAAEER